MSCSKLVADWVLQTAPLLCLMLALAAAQSQCATNDVFEGGRVAPCHPIDNGRCNYGVCWGEQLDGYSGLTVEFTDELAFSCTTPDLTIWLLSSREEYEACQATSPNSRRLALCNVTRSYIMYLISDAPTNIGQGSFIQVPAGQTEVYVASLSSDGTAGACADGAKMIIGVNQPVTTGTGSTDPQEPGPPTGPTNPVSVGELNSSGKGVLGCSLVMVLSALLLSILSLMY